MTIKRVQAAADRRGIYFNGVKKWLNNVVGYGYICHTPRGFIQADTIDGMYKLIKSFEIIKNN